MSFRIHINMTARSCSSGKRAFPDRHTALTRLRAARRRRAEDPARGRTPGRVETGVYECAGCGDWHLRSTRRRLRRGDFARRDRTRR